MGDRDQITQLLGEWAGGNVRALDALIPLVYAELRRIADGYLRRERTDHTLQPTALVHEAWLRIADHPDLQFDHRKQFFGLAAQVMRRVLVDHARSVNAEKRGAGVRKTSLDEASALSLDRTEEFLALDEALHELANVSPRQARIIEMRYFAGLNLTEIAALLDVSPATVSRDQRTAEAWLSHVMASQALTPNP